MLTNTTAASTIHSLHVARIDAEAPFLALAEEWRELAASAYAPTLFLSHQWFDAAWQWAKHDSELWLIAVRQNGALVGLCPLLRRHTQYRGLTMRKLEFLTVPDTQLCDVIVAPALAEPVSQAIACFLAEQKHEWDMIELRLLPDNSIAARHFAPALKQAGIRTLLETLGENPWIDLSQGWETFYASRSRSLKKKNNLIANRLRKAGQIEIDWVRPQRGSATDYAAALQTVIDISAKSWKQDTGNSLDQPGPNAFIQRLSQRAAEQGWLSIWLLRLDDKPLAMEYQLADEKHVYALRADFDSACPQELSPGSYLNMHLLERHFQSGQTQYCMGPGDNPYKYRWADRAHALHRLAGYSPTLKGRLLALLELDIKPTLQRWLKPRKDQQPSASKEENE